MKRRAKVDWKKLEYEFGQFLSELMRKGSIGTSQYCEYFLPLRARLEEGERTEKLYNEIQTAMKEYKL